MNEELQTCFKCGKTLPLTEFHKCPRMANGHFGKCKKCALADNAKRKSKLRKDPTWAAEEKRKNRELSRRSKSKWAKPTYEQRKRTNVQWKQRYPEKYAATSVCTKLPRRKGFCNHHWSYQRQHRTDIITLSIMQHALVHRFMIYDQERMMYRRMDGSLIDSREAAIEYYATLKDE